MNNIFKFFTPQDKKFHPLFEQAGSNALKISETLLEWLVQVMLKKGKPFLKRSSV